MNKAGAIDNCERSLIAFIHLPKSAGTTLHSILISQYNDRKHIFSSGFKTLNELREMDKSSLDAIGVVRGHMNFGVHRVIQQPCCYLTILRDPVERVRSHYFYLQHTSNHPLHELFKQTRFSFGEFIGMLDDNDNGQTRALAGVNRDLALDSEEYIEHGKCTEAVYDAAIANLNMCAVVGLQERFDETLILMKRVLGWESPPVYISQNIGNAIPKASEISESEIEMFKKLNEYDYRLYQHAKDIFENKIFTEGSSFSLEVKYFQLANRYYQEGQAIDARCFREIESYKTELERMQQTLSWRITAPIRAVRGWGPFSGARVGGKGTHDH